MKELKSCPFCESEEARLSKSTQVIEKIVGGIKKTEHIDYNHFIRCLGCGAQTDIWSTEEEAIEAWEKRA